MTLHPILLNCSQSEPASRQRQRVRKGPGEGPTLLCCRLLHGYSMNKVRQGGKCLYDAEDNDTVMCPELKSSRFGDYIAVDFHSTGNDKPQTNK
jgi:hypothetical protein